MTTEEKAREFWKSKFDNYDLSSWVGYVKMLTDFHNSQPPNLDLKCDENFEVLSEPKWDEFSVSKGLKVETVHEIEFDKLCQQYKDALTFRERITQLTKERDEWIRTSQNMALTMTDLNNELQAAKDRIKELENG